MSSSTDTLLRGVTNPKDRLRLLMESGSVDEFVTELNTQVEQHVAVFWYEPSGHGRDLLVDLENWDSRDDLCCLFLHIYDGDQYDLENYSFFRDEPLVKISTRWLVRYTKQRPQALNLLARIWDKMADTSFHDRWSRQVTDGMDKASQHFHGTSAEMIDKFRVARFVLRYHFRRGNDRTALNQVVYGKDAPVQIPDCLIDDAADEMLRLGMTEQEVQDELIYWLDEIALKRNYKMWPAVYKAKIICDDPRRNELLLGKLLPELAKATCDSPNKPPWMWCELRSLLQALPEAHQGCLRRYFEQRLINILSHGRAAFVYQFLYSFSSELGPIRIHEAITVCAFEAHGVAVRAKRWGVAAALGQQFAGVKDLEGYKHSWDMAVKLGQPIALDPFELIRFED